MRRGPGITIMRASLRRLAIGLAALVAAGTAQAQTVVVGARGTTEQQLVAEMTGQILKARGIPASRRAASGPAALRQALEAGQVDVAWDYTGAALATVHTIAERLDGAGTYARVKELDAARGLVWLNPSRANATAALAMRAGETKGVGSLTELAARIKGGDALRLGCDAFCTRPEGLAALQQAYGLEFGREQVVRMEAGLVYGALRDRQVDVGLVVATDGRVPAYGFALLKDDNGFFANQTLAPVVRRQALDRNPRLAEALNGLAARLDDTVVGKLAASVDVDRKTVEEVAAGFLKGMGLL